MANESLAYKICIIEGCLNTQHGTREMCCKHWGRWKDHADPFWGAKREITKSKGNTLEERFWSKVNKDGPTMPHMDTPCWEWDCPPSHIYGQFTYQGVHYLAHRLGWELENGKMPEELFACHKCDNRKCVRHDHIFPGTPLENMRDMQAKGRANYCGPKRQARGERVNTAVLSDDDIRKIRKRRDAGEELLPIATDYGISRTQVSRIGLRLQWKHVE